LPLVESSYDPNQESSAGAAGMWQLKASTARDIGLVVDSSVDERFSVAESTDGAIRYIKWLMGKFDGDIDLAIIAYNAGIGRVQRLIDEYGTRNPWLIAKGLLKGKEAEHYLARYYGYSLAMYAEGVCDENEQ
jgi:soluble lytic murein transglycosylase-like protein